MSVNCLIDTGSTLSVIHIRKFLSIPESQRPDKIYEGIQLKLANGEIIKTMGQADFDIKINGKIWKQRFVIAEIDAPAIIGYNFLYSKNCKLDIRHSKLTIEDFEIECQKESQMSSIFKIASEQNVILPPNSETIIMSKVLGDSSHLMDAMIEPVMKQDNEILVARALVDPSSGRIPLRIANLTSFERTLYKSTCLAECHLCDNIFEMENTERTNRKVFKIKESKADEVPEHLVTLFENSISNLTEQQGLQMKGVLKRQADAFANSKNELGSTDLIKHKINTGDATPIKQNPRRLPLAKQEVADREVQRMLDIGVIEPSISPWSSPIVLVPKKNDPTSVRFCIDYRRLNNLTKKDCFPLPRIEDCLDALRGAKFYSTIDLQSGYWQVQMDPADKEKTAFVTKRGLFQFRCMPFGLCNAGACFERLMECVLAASIKHFHHYVYGTSFLVRTDHGALRWLLNFKNPEGQTARWLEFLSSYNFEIQHRAGRQHGNADGLSRRPCTQCTHCTRQETKESNAEEDPSCYLRAVKTAKLDSKIREEIEIESTEQGANWMQSKTTEEILAAQQQDDTIAVILKLKLENQPKPKWEDISLRVNRLKHIGLNGIG
ncbi:Transposon Ty3-G Gag-Pol polyprotein,Transposon Ty3-I Gag-Pol polyprotein [Mytilus edulis]|uniref:Transposon Ty3-G Gag-Pol polyprotein,Transposon Ty3-I Gag-Pol polyprotein n=1 Tax=Mytilus edulis TaxID=6550 RepID=A0A8S3S4J4_MYTED|nr:Transposon Ty3-G Gag-Pol polyprotein,Transposon Ty3-I Gag-Pol polyprotein [Mytilus edulis]